MCMKPGLDQQKKRISRLLCMLRAAYPDARCELVFSSPLELAVAAILSAQCTDKRVNLVTPALFTKYRSVDDWASASQDVLEEEIHSTGFFRNKAANIRGMAQMLKEQYNGEFPRELAELIKLPGVGRKTANVLLISAFHLPGITVDTHCKRVTRRLGFTTSDNPDIIERELKVLLPDQDWSAWSHCVIFHGRRCCSARAPKCASCPVASLCPASGLEHA